MSTKKDWLQGLKPGDKVIVNYVLDGPCLRQVSRVTATQIIIRTLRGDGSHYDVRVRRRDGTLVGAEGYSRTYISEATPEVIEEIKRRNRRNYLSKLKWSVVDDATVDVVYAAVRASRDHATEHAIR